MPIIIARMVPPLPAATTMPIASPNCSGENQVLMSLALLEFSTVPATPIRIVTRSNMP